MRRFRELFKKIPILPAIYRFMREKYRMRKKSTEGVFTEIYEQNLWRGKDSVSGTGSDLNQTRNIVTLLPKIFRDFEINTMLDIPCGDFNWMNTVDLDGVDYLGADIVNNLVKENSDKYRTKGVQFRKLDLISSVLPKVDLIFCRDCLVHLSSNKVLQVLENICRSESDYFLTTTFTDREINEDIQTGDWRVLNLEREPFSLPPPLTVFNEGCTEYGGAYPDKSLALWRISDIKNRLSQLP